MNVELEVDLQALVAKAAPGAITHYTRALQEAYPGLRLIPYAGLTPNASCLAGGRLRGASIVDLVNQVEKLNASGVPIACALTGSVSRYRRDNRYNTNFDLRTDPVYPLLRAMVDGNARHQVTNSLTILRDDCLAQLNKVFPDHGLETWASCIRFVGELGAEEYRARLDLALSLYDAVVIDNPSTERILTRELQPERIAKLVIFLNSKCAIDSQFCKAHYANIERGVDLYQRTEGPIREMLACCERDDRANIKRPDVLALAARRGIRKLKWQRGSSYAFTDALGQLQRHGLLSASEPGSPTENSDSFK